MSWQIDHAHSQIMFTARHMMITKVRGAFEKFDGSVAFDEDYPENSHARIQVETTSINTRDTNRDAHLRSADFFNAEKFPYMTFVSTHMERTGENTARLTGDLTIRDVTKVVTFSVSLNGIQVNPWGKTSAGFEARAKINRKDWGLNWNVALEAGGVLVSEEIEISIEIQLVKAPQPELA